MTRVFTTMQRVIPEGENGLWKVEHFEVSKAESDITRMRAAIKGDAGLVVPPGKYTRLMNGAGWREIVVMSDTPSERHSNYDVVFNAHG